MAQVTMPRNKKVDVVHRQYEYFYKIGGGISLVLIGLWVGTFLFGIEVGYATKVFIGLLCVLATIFVFDCNSSHHWTRAKTF